MTLDRSQIEAVLERAFELDAATVDETVDVETVRRLADELGVSESALMQAMSEVAGERAGSHGVVAQASIPAQAADLEGALGSFLRLRGLITEGHDVWRQESGWWPDLYRFRAVTPVAVSIAPGDGVTVVSLTARLDRVWRGHVMAAVLAPLLVGLLLLAAPGLSSLVGGVVLGALWVGACGWAFHYRTESIRQRLASAIGEVSRPLYRLHPW